MDRDITEVFENFIKEYRSLEDSSDAFFEALDADEILQDEYREWCDAMGYSEKKGFAGYYHEYIESQDSIWDSMFPNKEEYNDYKKLYIPKIKKKINIIISTYTDSLTSIKRDYRANLSLEKRNFLNEVNVNEYNKSLLNMKEIAKEESINFYMFDTTNKTEREISIEIANTILDDMRKFYITEINKKIEEIVK